MCGLTLRKLLRRDNAARTHLIRGSVDRHRTTPTAITTTSAIMAAFVTPSTPADICTITSLSVAAMFIATLLLGTLLTRICRLQTLLCLF